MSGRWVPVLFGVVVLATVAGGAEPPAKKLLLIGIDGCRPDALLKADAPNLHGLRSRGAYTEAAQTGDITVSGPGWSSMLTGVWRDKHGVRDNSFEGKNIADYPSFLDRVKTAKPELRTASFATWAPIHTHIVKSADVKLTNKTDVATAAAAVKELTEQNPDLVFVDFDDVDHAGHSHGFSPTVPEYLKTIADTDAHVGAILKAIRARKNFANEDWLTLVTTDHGGRGKSHGANVPEIRTIFFIVNGPSVAPGEITSDVGVVDTAVTALTHLGVAVSPEWKLDGKSVGLTTAKVKPSR
ncbi:alkaline phosphatase family protein [Limnoglobus roseus]|uniref:Nucleotide pyrophosphatase n=1 Tax=Limnoglobus roseus TaxID=2598579 RepID=A0A5C1AKL6_9BACT|nr:alkaline phosphatase family protein [Limnoglobus roseus]QEL19761.1 hypothetical protein PX52LOC_06840 [Limnoglobus roseus]